ncbi:MAG: hypothetical protein WC527_04925 [Candidatus Margulisiibacteriota bacterium]
MKNISKILFLSLATAIVLAVSAYFAAANYFIPSVMAPWIVGSINDSFKGAAVLKIGSVTFNISKGIYLKDVDLSTKTGRIFIARDVDIDLDLAALIKKELKIKELRVAGTELNISRDRKGRWNFSPLVQTSEAGGGEQRQRMVFRTVVFSDSVIRFSDRMQKRNSIERRFVNGKVRIENVDDNIFLARISTSDPEVSNESISADLRYDAAKGSYSGRVKANTRYLDRYWTYYLDDMFFPWHFKAKDLGVEGTFSVIKDSVDIDAGYTVKKGVLRYGTIEARADAVIEQKLEIVEGDISKDKSTLKAEFRDVSIPVSGDVLKFKGLTCVASVTDKEIVFKKIHGTIGGKGFGLSGRYTFNYPRNIYLQGKYGDAYGILGVRLLSENTAEAELKGKTKGAAFEIHASVPDIKKLLAEIRMKAVISLPASGETIQASLQIGEYDVKVRVDFSCGFRGYLKDVSTLNGDADVNVAYLSGLSPDVGRVNFKMKVVDGIFEGSFPRTPFYGGAIYGQARTDIKKWGVEIHVDDFDLSDFSRISPKYKNLKGNFDGSLVCVADWDDFATARGGGYVDLEKANLRNVPIFSNTEAGIASLEAGFEMPEIESINGNFEISDEKITLQNMLCKAYRLNLYLAGYIDFGGNTFVTAGIRFIAGFWKTVRQVLLPFTIPFDIAASSVKISITGKWPALNQSTSIKDLQWLNEFFDEDVKPDPQKYKLEDFWGN